MVFAAPFILLIFALMIGAAFFMMGNDTEGDFDIRKQWRIHKQHKAYKRQQDDEWKLRQAALKKRKEARKTSSNV